MVSISFDIKSFSADLKAFQDKVERSLDSTVKQAADSIVSDAKAGDSDLPIIANSIASEKIENGYMIEKGKGMDDPIYAYSEFGTGNYAAATLSSYPQEWKDMAMDYFINGKGRTPARPSLKIAFDKNTANIGEMVAQKIGK